MTDVWRGQPVPPIRVVPLTPGHAEDICTWHYPAPYDCYDMTGSDLAGLTDAE